MKMTISIVRVGVFFLFCIAPFSANAHIFVDGGTMQTPTGSVLQITGLANITQDCASAQAMVATLVPPTAPQPVITCVEGTDTLTLTDGETVTKPIVLFGSARLVVEDGATVTFDQSGQAQGLPPVFVYVGGDAAVDISPTQRATLRNVNTSITLLQGGVPTTMSLTTGAFIVLRSTAAQTIRNVHLEAFGHRGPATTSSVVRCEATWNDDALRDVRSAPLTIHAAQSGAITIRDVTFTDSPLLALYTARDVTVENVTVTNTGTVTPLGFVRDIRSPRAGLVTSAGVLQITTSLADNARVEIVGASNATGDMTANTPALRCGTTALSAVVQTVQNGREYADGTVRDAVVRVTLTDDTGASYTNTTGGDLAFTVALADETAHGGDTDGDFDNTAQTAVIAPGSATADITIPVRADDSLETDETFRVILTPRSDNATAVSMTNGGAVTVTISDDSIAQATVSATPGAEGETPTPVTFTVTLDKVNDTGTAIPVTLALGSTSDTARGGVDYDDNNSAVRTASIAPGERTASFSVAVLSDRALEDAETVTGTVQTTASRVTMAQATATTQIVDNTAVSATLSATPGAEGGADMTFVVTLDYTNDTASPITFDIVRTDGSATVGDDYADTLGAHSLSVASGAAAGVLSVPVVDDALMEVTESLRAQISNPSHSAVTITTASATATITDNDTRGATISATQQGREDGTPVTFTVALDRINATGQEVTFALALSGTAEQGTDYVAPDSTVRIPSGEQRAVITISPLNDTIYEGEETIIATISDPSIAALTIDTSTATATLADDEVRPVTAVVRTVQNGAEHAPTDMIFEVVLSAPNGASESVAFDVTVDGGTASAEDYGSSVFGTRVVAIAPGETAARLTVPVVNDAVLEGEETVRVRIASPSLPHVTILTDTAMATIDDDEDDIVASENSSRDKGRDRSAKKKKKKTEVPATVVQTVTRPLRALGETAARSVAPRETIVPVAALRATEQKERPTTPTVTVSRNSPKVLGVQTRVPESSSRGYQWIWLVVLLLLLLLLAILLAMVLRRMIREGRQES